MLGSVPDPGPSGRQLMKEVRVLVITSSGPPSGGKYPGTLQLTSVDTAALHLCLLLRASGELAKAASGQVQKGA